MELQKSTYIVQTMSFYVFNFTTIATVVCKCNVSRFQMSILPTTYAVCNRGLRRHVCICLPYIDDSSVCTGCSRNALSDSYSLRTSSDSPRSRWTRMANSPSPIPDIYGSAADRTSWLEEVKTMRIWKSCWLYVHEYSSMYIDDCMNDWEGRTFHFMRDIDNLGIGTSRVRFQIQQCRHVNINDACTVHGQPH